VLVSGGRFVLILMEFELEVVPPTTSGKTQQARCLTKALIKTGIDFFKVSKFDMKESASFLVANSTVAVCLFVRMFVCLFVCLLVCLCPPKQEKTNT
jgi:hypothetical protein